ncbi:peptidoglycan D,D-transpeptidase FtsI family protein [Oribacterium sp. WCC10]|uniref:peptidoglycan D,D-transpeptidase FtsI family protein n=1 Tax=Oribacterium sp. WCC10 TaxID=1855343 RepID=UPI0008E8A302|nr:penicillin-binding transpeptidase domain-containing protein [Oribacterium sp. WCC10]SFG06458.1 Cell division protein FtsI/penicillin-binding protein 2 [Oribacterium sp. WCC10]
MANRNSRSGARKSNKNIIGFVYFFSLLFFAMIGYMIYFIGWGSGDLMGNAYNPRMEVFNNRFVRGAIISSDGQVLARTNVSDTRKNSDGSDNPDGAYTETREYPFGETFAQAVGYSTKGKTGVEALANFYLMESNSNPVVQVVNEITETKSQGDNVITTLDAGLQKVAYEALGEHNGAVIAVNPKTGEVLAMASKPSYDPNSVVQDWDYIVNERSDEAPLLNRCTQGLYAPGSTFKIVMALEYIREHPNDYQNFEFHCNGAYHDEENSDYVVHCYSGEVHGSEDLKAAFTYSCNSAFAKIGTVIDKSRLAETAEKLLFNQELPIAVSSSKSRFNVTESSGTWTMMQTAIGQGETMMSPLHEVILASAIANKGVLAKPKLLKQVQSAEGNVVKVFDDTETEQLMTESEATILGSFMRSVVSEGTASKLRDAEYEAAGKTGSAEVVKNGETITNAWFTGFAPYNDPEIAVCVVVEEGETGGRTAVPVAKEVFDYWINER